MFFNGCGLTLVLPTADYITCTPTYPPSPIPHSNTLLWVKYIITLIQEMLVNYNWFIKVVPHSEKKIRIKEATNTVTADF